MTAMSRLAPIGSIALPALLLVLSVGTLAFQVLPATDRFAPAVLDLPETVTLPPGTIDYRSEGQFFLDNRQVDAPMVTARIEAPLTIMKYQVTAASYAICVAEGACAPAEPSATGSGNVPATGVSFADATGYAEWLSLKTGVTWTLPTDAQWAYAADERFTDDALGTPTTGDPAQRWLTSYREGAARQATRDAVPLPLGSFGENANGLADMAGNVWEWTQTCQRRVRLDQSGALLSEQPACGQRVLEGRHRTALTYFIRGAKSGGCSVGVPPDNLGFRLVRQVQ